MKNTKVIAYKNLPPRLPIMFTWLAALSQSQWNMPGWLIGVMWTFVGLIWVGLIINHFTADFTDIFNDE